MSRETLTSSFIAHVIHILSLDDSIKGCEQSRCKMFSRHEHLFLLILQNEEVCDGIDLAVHKFCTPSQGDLNNGHVQQGTFRQQLSLTCIVKDSPHVMQGQSSPRTDFHL